MANRDESEGRKMSVSKEQIKEQVDDSKGWLRRWAGNDQATRNSTTINEVIVALADENDRLRAERDECARLFERALSERRLECTPEPNFGAVPDNYTCIACEARALLAKLRTP